MTWMPAFAGSVFKRLSTPMYIAMGWLSVLAVGPMPRQLDVWTLGWLLAGGVAYTAATLFCLDPRSRYSLAIWRGFVIAGSICHFIALSLQVHAPAAATAV